MKITIFLLLSGDLEFFAVVVEQFSAMLETELIFDAAIITLADGDVEKLKNWNFSAAEGEWKTLWNPWKRFMR